jgi:hypothetical protein
MQPMYCFFLHYLYCDDPASEGSYEFRPSLISDLHEKVLGSIYVPARANLSLTIWSEVYLAWITYGTFPL